MKKLNNKAQVSVEYLILLALGAVLATIITVLAFNIFGMKDNIKLLIQEYRKVALNLK